MPTRRAPQLLTRSEFARLAGVSPAAVTKAAKKSLAPAVRGDRLDAGHPAAAAYLDRRRARAKPPQLEPTAPAENGKAEQARPTPPGDSNGSGSNGARSTDAANAGIDAYADLTMREAVEKFGTARALNDWLEAIRKIEDVKTKRLANEEYQRGLISRDLVKAHVFGAIEAGNRRLLSDTPKTITRRLYALARSGAPLEEAEQIVRDVLSSQLDPVKVQAARALRKPTQ